MSYAEAHKSDLLKFSSDEQRLAFFFNCLNDEGKTIAADRVEELTEIPKYQRKDPPSDSPTEAPEDE